MAGELWGDTSSPGEQATGKGKVYWGKSLEDVLEEVIQDEIVDESDAFVSNDQTTRVVRSTSRGGKGGRVGGGAGGALRRAPEAGTGAENDSAFSVTVMGEGLAACLMLRMDAASRSGDAATGSMKQAAQGNRVRGFPCYKMIETDREAVRLLNTCKQTGGLTSPALPLGGSFAAGVSGGAALALPTTFDFTDEPHTPVIVGGT